jgi:hypothetical protein
MRAARLVRVAVLGLAAVALLGGEARAGLIGTQVTGSLTFGGGGTNFFDPANGFVPTGYLNKTQGTTVTISGSAVEFGFSDGANRDTADFSDVGLTLEDLASTAAGGSSSRYVFTDPAFAGLSLVKLTDTFAGGVDASLRGTTLTINVPAFSGAGDHVATFGLTSGASATVPEPSTLGLLALGGLGLAGWRRWKKRHPLA